MGWNPVLLFKCTIGAIKCTVNCFTFYIPKVGALKKKYLCCCVFPCAFNKSCFAICLVSASCPKPGSCGLPESPAGGNWNLGWGGLCGTGTMQCPQRVPVPPPAPFLVSGHFPNPSPPTALFPVPMHCSMSWCPFPYSSVPFPMLLLCSSSQCVIPNPSALFLTLVPYSPSQSRSVCCFLSSFPVLYPGALSLSRCVIPQPGASFLVPMGYSPSKFPIPHPDVSFPFFSILVRYSPSLCIIPLPGVLFPIPVFCSLSRWVIPLPDALFPISVRYSPS